MKIIAVCTQLKLSTHCEDLHLLKTLQSMIGEHKNRKQALLDKLDLIKEDTENELTFDVLILFSKLKLLCILQ